MSFTDQILRLIGVINRPLTLQSDGLRKDYNINVLQISGKIELEYFTLISATAKSFTGGLQIFVKASSMLGWKRTVSGDLLSYSSIPTSVGTSMNLGVSPALTTLSEQAMHSIQSEKNNIFQQNLIEFK